MRIIPLTVVFFFPLLLLGQSKPPDCSKIKKGIFYFYPAGTDKCYRVDRGDSVQEEIDLTDPDTSFWKVDWQDPCHFSLAFISNNPPVTGEKLDFMNSHTVICEVQKVTKRYYIFKARMDPDPGEEIPADTLWVRKRELK